MILPPQNEIYIYILEVKTIFISVGGKLSDDTSYFTAWFSLHFSQLGTKVTPLTREEFGVQIFKEKLRGKHRESENFLGKVQLQRSPGMAEYFFNHFVSFEKKTPVIKPTVTMWVFCNKIYVNDDSASWSPTVTNGISSKFNFNEIPVDLWADDHKATALHALCSDSVTALGRKQLHSFKPKPKSQPIKANFLNIPYFTVLFPQLIFQSKNTLPGLVLDTKFRNKPGCRIAEDTSHPAWTSPGGTHRWLLPKFGTFFTWESTGSKRTAGGSFLCSV